MTYQGTVQGGVVVIQGPDRPPEGAQVRVEMMEPRDTAAEGRPWAEVLGSVIGKAQGLPEDLAENHDHYIHGTPRR